MSYQWTTPVRYVRGLGPQRSRELNKLGIETVGNLLERHPLSYIFPGVTPIEDVRDGQVTIRAEIKSLYRVSCGATIGATLSDVTGSCNAFWYNGAWLLQQLRPGMTATFYGKMKGSVLQQPKWTTVESTMENVYGGQYGVHHNTIRAALKEVLAHVELPDMIDGLPRVDFYRMFHFPRDFFEQKQVLRSLKHDEALQLQLALQERRRGREQSLPIQRMKWDSTIDVKLMGYFSYEFTDNQDEATTAIIEDVCQFPRYHPMQRLIHGEVGSGKTAVAFYAAMLTALNGKRTVILAPTTILAQQHYDTLRGMGWDDVQLTTKGLHPGRYRNIVIGTHALLSRPALLRSASLVIIDEFQKFGVTQRALATKNNPHLLLLSATPIPRTLAATVFGDLDVSTIRQLPIKRGTVVTKQVLPEKREAMYDIIEKELAKGHQAYVVYPRINGDEQDGSAMGGFKGLLDRFSYDGWVVDLLTGKDTTDRKANALKRFKQRWTHILVSTIIAEVGLDNPNATVMVVEGADRFGLSQLHQLRGRICRSEDIAYCFLVSETANEKSIARLDVIEKCNDGFLIAEHDLRLRGCGEVFSTKQHGLPDLKFISLVDDFDLIQEAKELVQSETVGEGPKAMMRIRYDGLLQFGDIV